MEHPEHAPAPPPRRTATRRAILIGSASLAAAGSAAAVVGVAARSGEQKVTIPMLAVSGTTGATPSSGPAAVANAPVADPRKRAAHLLRRAGFGGSPAEIEAFAKLSRDEAADRLLNFGATANTTLDARLQAAKFELSDFGNGLMRDMQRWWFTRMAYTARPLEERMAFLWHGLLTSQLSKIGREHAKLMVKQNELFRAMALPKYGDLLQAVSKDPAMLTYLDNVESSKEHPNENYARELMELFSMGVGNYSEDDIRESARAFTGWRITAPERRPRVEGLTPAEQQQIRREAIAAWNPEFRFAVRQHDNGAKTFLGRTGAWDGDDIINIVMEQPATGRFISTRLFEEFAYPGPATETVDRLVQTWDSSGHDIGAVVRAILVSDEFYSEEAYRGKVRSPVEFIVGLVRGLEMEFDTAGLGVAGGHGATPTVPTWPWIKCSSNRQTSRAGPVERAGSRPPRSSRAPIFSTSSFGGETGRASPSPPSRA